MVRNFLACLLMTACMMLLSLPHSFGQRMYTVSGFISEAGSQERLPGVSVYLPDLKTGISSNTYGFYSLSLPEGKHHLRFSFVGYETFEQEILLSQDTTIQVALEVENRKLESIEIVAGRQERPSQLAQMSRIKVPVEQVKAMPGFLGEKDVLKTIQMLPGIQSGSEGNSGLYVRGGGADQNLLILDDAVVYNASHLFGFFSVFNGDALKNVELYKGDFPTRFGGRLSSIVKMDMKDGHREEYHGKASIGLISSSMVLEGPVIKNKASFLVASRRSYLDLLMKPFMSSYDQTGYYFYDVNAKVNSELGKRDRLYLSGYFGRDQYQMKDGSSQNDNYVKGGIDWGNKTLSLRWNHLFSDKVFANTSLLFSDYNFGTNQEEKYYEETYFVGYSSAIRDYGFKYDVDYMINPRHQFKTGVQFMRHEFTPNAFVISDEWADQFHNEKEEIQTFEAALYAEDLWKLSERFQLSVGMRLSFFMHNEKSYWNPEPRLSAIYLMNETLSLKASYALMNQYVHLLTNSGIGLPTDLWVPATDRVAPQQSQQWAMGVAKDFPNQGLNFSLEGYYKQSGNIISYKDGASFLVLEDPESAEQMRWEDNVTSGKGWSYGAELFVQKQYGRLTGWAGYTLSWTQVQFEELNHGKPFWAKHDRRHDFSVVGTYQMREGITLSASWVYGTGNALTLARRQYIDVWHNPGIGNSNYSEQVDYLEGRGNFRAEAYHRLDIGMQFTKQKKYWKRTWDIGLYNAYNRRNPYFYYTERNFHDGKYKLMKQSLFPVLPGVSYRIEF